MPGIGALLDKIEKPPGAERHAGNAVWEGRVESPLPDLLCATKSAYHARHFGLSLTYLRFSLFDAVIEHKEIGINIVNDFLTGIAN